MAVPEAVFNITVCGQREAVVPGHTVHQYLTRRGINPSRVVVEINGRIIPREEYPTYVFQPGDRVEIVQFVGGGAQ
jgi:sulfur carrier protein